MSLRRVAAQKLRPKIVDEMAWADLREAINNGTVSQKAAMLAAAKRGDADAVGKWICQLFASAVDAKLEAELTTMLADSAMSETEIARIFG